YNIDLNNSTVELVKKSDSGTLPSEHAISFAGTNTVHEVHMTSNERILDGIRNFHGVDVTGLQPGTEYVYRVGDATEDVWSQLGSFKTASASKESFLFTYMTDPQGTTSSAASAATIKSIQSMFPEQAFSFIAGDFTENGYSNGQWDVFFQAAQELFL